MFSKRFVAASAVAVTSFASVAGEPPASLKAADPAAQVSQTTYTSAFSTYIPAATDNVSPDKVWKEANATVASEGMHGGAHAGHVPAAQGAGSHSGHTMPTQGATSSAHAGQGTPAEPAGQTPHAGHQMPAQAIAPAAPTGQRSPAAHTGHQMAPAVKEAPHAGHQMAPMTKPDPHAGHQMTPVTKPDPHAGHQMAPVPKPDPHAGHQMGQEKMPANATRPVPAKGGANEASHEQHQQQGKETKK